MHAYQPTIAGIRYRVFQRNVAGANCPAYLNNSVITGTGCRECLATTADTECRASRAGTNCLVAAGAYHSTITGNLRRPYTTAVAGAYCSAWRTTIRHRRSDGSVASHMCPGAW